MIFISLWYTSFEPCLACVQLTNIFIRNSIPFCIFHDTQTPDKFHSGDIVLTVTVTEQGFIDTIASYIVCLVSSPSYHDPNTGLFYHSMKKTLVSFGYFYKAPCYATALPYFLRDILFPDERLIGIPESLLITGRGSFDV